MKYDMRIVRVETGEDVGIGEGAKGMSTEQSIAWVVGVGASRGLGAAVARCFARKGFNVAVTGRSPAALATVVEEIIAAGGHAAAYPGDARDETSLLAILARLEAIGPIEVGVYNAGNAIWGAALETTSADFESVWRVGCFGGFVFGREVGRRMLPRGRGTIVFTGATAALRGKASFIAFAAAKPGLRMVSQSFARAFGPQGIHVAHAIIDGSIEGDKIFSVKPDIAQRKGPDGLLDPDAIAEGYWYLHTQHRSVWSQEMDFRPYAENF
jgi:NAD(P)-dependent dehydrogenase (short-subunit alcohol dehydrogenase family)